MIFTDALCFLYGLPADVLDAPNAFPTLGKHSADMFKSAYILVPAKCTFVTFRNPHPAIPCHIHLYAAQLFPTRRFQIMQQQHSRACNPGQHTELFRLHCAASTLDHFIAYNQAAGTCSVRLSMEAGMSAPANGCLCTIARLFLGGRSFTVRCISQVGLVDLVLAGKAGYLYRHS